MRTSWSDAVEAFSVAADRFAATAAAVGDRWDAPGLGEWDVRALAGHTGRALLTVEAYLARPAERAEIASPADYYRATRAVAAGPGVAARGREAGAALGDDPAAAVAAIAERVVALVRRADGDALVTTAAGGMRLADYLPTRTFELVVHTADLAAALGAEPSVPEAAGRQALELLVDLAVGDGLAARLLLGATGRTGLPDDFTVL